MAGVIAPGFWQVDAEFVMSDPSRRLAEALQCSAHSASMYRALLYGWAVKVHIQQDGNISAFRNKAIEKACLWTGENNVLFKGFYSAGILAGDPDDDNTPLVIVDWAKLAEHIFRARKDNKTRAKTYRKKHTEERSPPSDDVTDDVTRYATPPIIDTQTYTHTHIHKENDSTSVRSGTDSNYLTDYEDLEATTEYARNSIRGFSDQNAQEVVILMTRAPRLPGDLIRYAIDEACGAGKVDGWGYTKTILKRYKAQGITTLQAAIADSNDFQNAKRKARRGY